MADVPTVGRLKAERKGKILAAWCDALCYDEGSAIMYAAVVAPANMAKAFGAALNGRTTVRFDPEDLEFRGGPKGTDRPSYTPTLWASPARYRRSFCRLGHDWVHAAWACKDPAFLPSVDPESLWRALRRPEWTTPLLRDWLPHVTRELVEAERLRYLFGHGCRCGKLVAKVADLDEIVSRGLRAGTLEIPAAARGRREAV